jgi:hypothetical protein
MGTCLIHQTTFHAPRCPICEAVEDRQRLIDRALGAEQLISTLLAACKVGGEYGDGPTIIQRAAEMLDESGNRDLASELFAKAKRERAAIAKVETA